jgi:hypothetical protein
MSVSWTGAVRERLLGDSSGSDHNSSSRRRRSSAPHLGRSLYAAQGRRNSSSKVNNRVTVEERYEYALEQLRFSQADLIHLIYDTQGGFEGLQKSLKSSGAVTNSLLKQGLHFYIKKHNMAMQSLQEEQDEEKEETQEVDPATVVVSEAA